MNNFLKVFKFLKVLIFIPFLILNSCSNIDYIIKKSKEVTVKKTNKIILESDKEASINLNINNNSSLPKDKKQDTEEIIANPIYKIGDPYEINKFSITCLESTIDL